MKRVQTTVMRSAGTWADKPTRALCLALLFIVFIAATLAASAEPAQDVTVYPPQAGNDERISTRQLHWYENASPGQFAINYNPVPWKAEYAEQFDALTLGKYFRLGQEFWTILDTNIPLTISGLEVPVGEHYLAVRRSQDGQKWELVLFDAASIRAKRLPAGFLHRGTAEGMKVFGAALLRHQPLDEPAEKLTIVLSSKPDDLKAGLAAEAAKHDTVLLIDFGPHRLSAPIEGHWAYPENEFPPHRSIAERASTRRYYYRPGVFLGQSVINYNLVEWRPEHAEKFDELTKGSYWRLGRNFWTVLDTSTAVEISGTEIPAGYYYLLVHRSQDGSQWTLHVLDPEPVREKHLDSAQARPEYGLEMPVLYRAPLHFKQGQDVSERLRVVLSSESADEPTRVSLEIAFGPYRLTAAARPIFAQE